MVYVDDFYKTGITLKTSRGRELKMSHMIADSREELFAMARKLDLNLTWIQNPNTEKEHFDVGLQKRALAIKYGATAIDMRTMVRKLQARATRKPGEPSAAEKIAFLFGKADKTKKT